MMTELIDKKVIQDALIEKISRLNAEGEKSIQTAREFIRFKRYVDGITPIESVNRPTNTPTDLISRQDAIEEIESMPSDSFELADDREWLISKINALPSKADGPIVDRDCLIEWIRPKGEWIWSPKDTDGTVSGCCSNCSFSHLFTGGHTAQYRFCPSCGADMRGEAE